MFRVEAQVVVEMLVSSERRRGKNSVNRVEPFRCAWTGETVMRKEMIVRKTDECSMFEYMFIYLVLLVRPCVRRRQAFQLASMTKSDAVTTSSK